jgi:peptidoglycan/xylan/chitin deacetylase (PgdA/CDA1 family)
MILCYHSVSVRPDLPSDLHKQHIPVHLFRAHLDYLQRYSHVVSLKEYVRARRAGQALPHGSVVLTFDDGFRNFLTVAAPLLVQLGLPATAFIITEKASEREIPEGDLQWNSSHDRTFLSWPEIHLLARQHGIDFGSHSHSHPELTAVSPEEVERELKNSLERLVQKLGCEEVSFAYPHGRTTAQISELARAAGYTCAVTGTLGANKMETDPHQLYRIIIAADDDLATFAARVAGLTWWADRIRAFFLRPVKRSQGAQPQRTPLQGLNRLDYE